jgi:hypothetical protein
MSIRIAHNVPIPVDLSNLQPQMVVALLVVEGVFGHFGYEAIITSGRDGKHRAGSLHYLGRALDFRTRHVISHHKTQIVDSLAARLGPDYDVVLEETHLHVEYDPKGPGQEGRASSEAA